MDEETHQTFLQAYKGTATLQKGVETKSEGLFQDTSHEKGKSQMSPDISEEEFNLIVLKALKPLQAPFMQKALTLEQYSSYTSWVYFAHNTNSRIIDTYGKYPRIHFLAGSDTQEVTRAVIYGYCGSITSSPGNHEILGMHKSTVEAVKKFRKSSQSGTVVLKLPSASPEVRPVPVLGWTIVQFHNPNKANLKFNENKALQSPTVDEIWVCDRRVAGFAIILRKLQQI